eukprot:6464358-Amphidinium_carterae.2
MATDSMAFPVGVLFEVGMLAHLGNFTKNEFRLRSVLVCALVVLDVLVLFFGAGCNLKSEFASTMHLVIGLVLVIDSNAFPIGPPHAGRNDYRGGARRESTMLEEQSSSDHPVDLVLYTERKRRRRVTIHFVGQFCPPRVLFVDSEFQSLVSTMSCNCFLVI